ncbi:MAG: hypothetical protein N3A66_10165, partial [Planctomycetota bacterium]|nr:hypothetical protein [Planctomycetota bacterium]
PSSPAKQVVDEIDLDYETSYSLSFGCQVSDRANKITFAEEGRGASKVAESAADSNGNINHDDGQNCLYKDSHVKFAKSNKPDDDADEGSIYQRTLGSSLDTDTVLE